MNYPDYKKQCSCGNYEPYYPEGIVAALQPFGSCTNCYHKPLAQATEEEIRVPLDNSLVKELELISTMTVEELTKYLDPS